MAVSGMLVSAAVGAASAVDQHRNAKKAREQAEQEAARQREALATLKDEAPPAMPGEADAKAAKRRSIAGQASRRGRSSTLLTGGGLTGDTLGT